MRRFAVVSMVLMMGPALSCVAAEREHTISVVGNAEETVKPDVAYVTLYAQADGILMVDAVKKVETLIGEITSAINTQTNTVKDITIVDVALGEKRQRHWGPDQKDEAPRPQVARRIRVSCEPEPAGIYEVIDRAIRAGALMQIPSTTSYSDDIRSVVVYGLENSAGVLDRVRRSAMEDAKAEAKDLADLAGKTVGDVVTIGCSGSSHFSFPVRVMGRTADYPTEHVGTNPEAITLSHRFSVTFELKD